MPWVLISRKPLAPNDQRQRYCIVQIRRILYFSSLVSHGRFPSSFDCSYKKRKKRENGIQKISTRLEIVGASLHWTFAMPVQSIPVNFVSQIFMKLFQPYRALSFTLLRCLSCKRSADFPIQCSLKSSFYGKRSENIQI